MVDDFFNKITSEKYKQKVEQARVAFEMANEIIKTEKKIHKNREKLLNLLLATQSASIIAIITLIAAVMVLI